ncbi:response regulator [Clostridium lacusfryxellense]|uniref:response regulator n=1 Tax=Clostridium lacusfryxellense TaxID=205328 RepID=UPI001C0D9318|nr:response regulator [Clostridium lacusfryxellense]MBU3113702.1 response regulator [Clostridium lacusfryxellense]
MIKVMIVDDNKLIRQSIIMTMEWELIGCNVVCEAANGVEAMNLAVKYSPDLIITDIRMPELDGLELTEKVKEYLPFVKVIIITGYDEFKYAQKAVKIGAFDIILKPINNEELYDVITRAVNELGKEKESLMQKEKLLEEKRNMQKEISDSILELREKYIIDIIDGVYFGDEINEEDSIYFGVSFKKHGIFIIKPDLSYYKSGVIEKELRTKFISYSKEAIKNIEKFYDFEFICFWINDGLAIMVIPRRDETERVVNIKIIEICNRIIDWIYDRINLKVIIGVSNIFNGVGEVKDAYNEAREALECRFFISNKALIHANVLECKNILNEYLIMKKINLIYEYIRADDQDGMEKLINDIFNEIKNNETSDVNYVKNLLIDICMITLRIMYEKSEYKNDTYKGFADIHSDIKSCCNILDAFKYVNDFIVKVFQCVNSSEKKSYSSVTNKVIDYLNENYNRKIPLSEVSQIVSLSPTHLSRVIKRDTGETYIDLFNNLKINIAAKLLKETNLKVYEVASKVGIENYSYFYQLFKKLTGISPTEYNK